MNPSDKPQFTELVTGALAYYRQDCTPFSLGVWWQGCQPFDIEQVRKAMTAHATDPDGGQYAPKVADIVRLLEGTKTDRSQVAWSKAFAAMSDVGAYRDVVFDDAAIHAAIADLGGWTKVCRANLDDLSYMQHRFCEAYRTYVARGGFDYPRVLAGDRSPDEMYAKRGLPPPKPAVVGDVEQARLVYRGGAGVAKSLAHILKPLLEPA